MTPAEHAEMRGRAVAMRRANAAQRWRMDALHRKMAQQRFRLDHEAEGRPVAPGTTVH